MTVLDAYALVAYLADELAADEVTDLLAAPALMSTLNLAEVVDHLVRVRGMPETEVHADVHAVGSSGVHYVAVSSELALRAAGLRARHYHRTTCSVSLADCVAAATALSNKSPLATSDPALAAVVRAEGGDVIALPDRRGRRP